MAVVRTKHRSFAGISLIFATAMVAQASSVQEAVDENITSIEVAIEDVRSEEAAPEEASGGAKRKKNKEPPVPPKKPTGKKTIVVTPEVIL